MTTRFIVSSEAAADLREIVDFIAENNPSAAHRFLARMREEIGRIAAHPRIGHARMDLTDRPLRFWPVARYLVIYREEVGKPVEVVRVLHSARDVAALLEPG